MILPSAFTNDELTPAAKSKVSAALSQLSGPFAVRSSALSEDSAQASFAGEFETVLDVNTEAAVLQAIQTVRQSRHAERVQAYSAAQNLDTAHEMAVVVQQLVRADLAGVLFTADPVTGSHGRMVGNYVHGLGESLVSGEANAQSFTLQRPSGKYEGAEGLRRHARALSKLGTRLEAEAGAPQDIEWAIAGGRLYLLQARPITTFNAFNPLTFEWNDSLAGDYLWTNTNYGEAIPHVMTPATWSMIQILQEEFLPFPLPGHHPIMGNIGGRFYMNISVVASMLASIGMKRARLKYESEEFFGTLSDDIEVPLLPFTFWDIAFTVLPRVPGLMSRAAANRRRVPEFLAQVGPRYADLLQRIEHSPTPAALLPLWRELRDFFSETCLMLQAGTSQYENAYRPLRHTLRKLVGEAETPTLLTGLSEGADRLASLGPVLGLAQVAQGTLSREAYATQWGHRGPDELELAVPRPVEDPAWLDGQLAQCQPAQVEALLAGQQTRRAEAWARLTQAHPRQAATLQKKSAQAAQAARNREAIRSELVRGASVWRAFYLRAAELLNLKDEVFFLTLDEIRAVLSGEASALAFIPARRATHARLNALPPYPSMIRGRFNPEQWAADPNRRSDFYHPNATLPPASNGHLTGFPGAMGVVEGTVRVLHSMEHSADFQNGEILVTTTTNVGWTPLFPRAAAIVTDVGAPLSHAAIVARELGIPAVVGCGNATMRLRTGDRVRVNGGQGIVEVLSNGVVTN